MILLLVVWEDLSAHVSPGHSRETTDGPSSSKLRPSLRALEGVAGDVASGQSLNSDLRNIVLEGHLSVHGEAQGEDQHKSSSGHASSNLGSISGCTSKVTQRTKLDEWTDQQKPVGKSNLDTSEKWRNSSAVCWEVGQVVCHQRRRGDWGLEHADEWISVNWLNHLKIASYIMQLVHVTMKIQHERVEREWGAPLRLKPNKICLSWTPYPTRFYPTLVPSAETPSTGTLCHRYQTYHAQWIYRLFVA